MAKPNLDHPSLPLVKQQFPNVKFLATQFRNQTTLVVPPENLHKVMTFLRDDPGCAYNFLSDVIGVDYLDYPTTKGESSSTTSGEGENGRSEAGEKGRFAVIYMLISHEHNRRLWVKVFLNPTLDTRGIEDDPALYLPSMCDLWPGAEWPEREVFDMFGIRFDNHPDLRRILTWESYPAHPLRKDYPLRGRSERETFEVVTRDSA